ncbi:gamma carbonic anhydrase family protein [Rhodocyclus tenuis]|uniref:Carbonic anhydrase/acetyltransferase-like protein (Isoleucine patch superfamily) n=1 Tax=Rhodocyclus tenuis TaxID=1066 RepID=A0A840G110_RHOTE|nr:gamma carbonic anhydrase family protein [Rhodocyclus tenuis]MBB4247914.1 carbonic anhydrase/acetyltransferase-like protein (isoleucine patch superfamily) [Rhodocyclus tenuis]MBK1679254.1 gamma carbonic anhydrase family protein [Rhodocyclus tenuis]
MPLYRFGDQRPQVDPQTWIAPDAVLIGDVRLGRNASVWWKAVLRGDNDPITIGEDSNIQDGSVLHTDIGVPLTIGRGVTIGHRVILHGCTIGDGALIGMGATVLNRARIGAQSIVGAHALIAEGKEYPERSLIVGAPGRLIRQLSEEEAAALASGAAHYIEKWRRCLGELERLAD